MRLTNGWLPLRGRWLHYFVLACGAVVILALIAAQFPVRIVTDKHQPPPGWRPAAVPAPQP